LFILLFFLFGLYKKIYKYHRKNDFGLYFISAIGVIYLFTTLTITGIYNGRDVIIFILGALFCFHFKESILIKK
jgi:glucan phosphoethanolaminetransferase (alkaline phosphatase superfamily)